jgi:hypothetical protein
MLLNQNNLLDFTTVKSFIIIFDVVTIFCCSIDEYFLHSLTVQPNNILRKNYNRKLNYHQLFNHLILTGILLHKILTFMTTNTYYKTVAKRSILSTKSLLHLCS